MIRLLRKDTVCASSANVCRATSAGSRWNFGHEWLKVKWRSFTLDMTWYVDSRLCHAFVCDLANRNFFTTSSSRSRRPEVSVSLSTRLRDATEIVYRSRLRAVPRIRESNIVRWRFSSFSRRRKKIITSQIIFNEINNRYLERRGTKKRKDQSSKNLYTPGLSLAICRHD
jgi:hypothetical protein